MLVAEKQSRVSTEQRTQLVTDQSGSSIFIRCKRWSFLMNMIRKLIRYSRYPIQTVPLQRIFIIDRSVIADIRYRLTRYSRYPLQQLSVTEIRYSRYPLYTDPL